MEKYYYGVYKNDYLCWIKTDTLHGRYIEWAYWGYSQYQGEGKIYKRSLHAITRQAYVRSGLREYLIYDPDIMPESYFKTLQRKPIVERLSKAGLYVLAADLVRDQEKIDTVPGKSLAKELKIDASGMERLRKNKGGIRYLEWLQYEKQDGHALPEHVIQWMIRMDIRPHKLEFVCDRMNVVQIYHYLCKQQKKCGENVAQLLITWKDYLSMALKLGKNVRDPIIYRTTDLKEAHDKAVILLEKRSRDLWIKEMEEKYPHATPVCQLIREKYEYMDEAYAIIAPNNLQEVIEEGIALHHCVGSQERYYDRIDRQESYILFLRRKEDLHKPYYTLEVEPGGTVRQIRAQYDKRDDNFDKINAFVYKWQKEILKRMKKEDFRLAKTSTELRKSEYEQLRKNHVIIHRGLFAGQWLADILEKDLLENEAINAGLLQNR